MVIQTATTGCAHVALRIEERARLRLHRSLVHRLLTVRTVGLIAVIVLRCRRHRVRGHTSVEIIIRKVYNCFAVLVYLMILIAAENVAAAHQVRWVVDVVHDICVNVVDVVRYIIPAAATRARLLANVADVIILLTASAAVEIRRRCTCRGRVGIENPIVMRKEDVAVAVVDVDLRLRQR